MQVHPSMTVADEIDGVAQVRIDFIAPDYSEIGTGELEVSLWLDEDQVRQLRSHLTALLVKAGFEPKAKAARGD